MNWDAEQLMKLIGTRTQDIIRDAYRKAIEGDSPTDIMSALRDEIGEALSPIQQEIEECAKCSLDEIILIMLYEFAVFACGTLSPRPKIGSRVVVWNGSHTKKLGKGVYEGNATVYVAVTEEGNILSNYTAEYPIDIDLLPDGCTTHEIEDNPKIQMDNGDVYYGCQVWWEVDEQVSPEIENIVKKKLVEMFPHLEGELADISANEKFDTINQWGKANRATVANPFRG